MNDKQRQLALDVMTNAVETGAIGYWATMHERPKRVEMDDDDAVGDILEFKIVESEDEYFVGGEAKTYTVDAGAVLVAMEKIMNGDVSIRHDLRQNIGVMFLMEDYCAEGVPGGDAETDDCIVQIVCFGKLVYG